MKKAFLICAVVLCFTAFASATETAEAQPAQAASNELEQSVRELMRITGSGDIGMQMVQTLFGSMRQAMPEVPAEWWDTMAAKISADDLEEMVIPIYTKHFTQEEIQAVLEFYGTPAGRKLITKMPVVFEESVQAGQAWGLKIGKELLKELETDGYDTSKLGS